MSVARQPLGTIERALFPSLRPPFHLRLGPSARARQKRAIVVKRETERAAAAEKEREEKVRTVWRGLLTAALREWRPHTICAVCLWPTGTVGSAQGMDAHRLFEAARTTA